MVEANVLAVFENDVKTYGTQARLQERNREVQFENDVKTYGTQAMLPHAFSANGLRMM